METFWLILSGFGTFFFGVTSGFYFLATELMDEDTWIWKTTLALSVICLTILIYLSLK